VNDLERILEDHRIIVCLGCGGVGKTTIAASVALRAALNGQRSLCLTIDPARRLATSLGLGRMRAQEQQVDPLAFIEAGLMVRGQLWAAVVDGKSTFDEVVRRLAESPETAERILNNRIYRYVSASMPGVQEYMAMERLCAARENSQFDRVILDTPPTSNALDFLDAPRRVTAAMNSPAVSWLMALREEGVLSQGTAFVMRQLGRLAGNTVLDRMAELASDFDTMLAGLRERAALVDATLRGDDVAYVVITSPSPLAVDEAIFLNHRLVDMGLAGGTLVVNRMHPLRRGTPDMEEDDLTRTLQAQELQEEEARRLSQAMLTSAREERALAQEDLRQVEKLRRSCRNIAGVCLVPSLERDVYELTQLVRLHQWLFPS
jgi:anion-transporting  ArsA/GET3 family ATPase